jgi:hypothetical protein
MSITITAQLVPVYKFYATDPWRFFYSTNLDDAAIRSGWTRAEKVAFFAYHAPTAHTVPVYRFVATAPYRYQYSTQPTPAGSGWKNEGAAFYALPATTKPRPGILPVLQYHAVAPDGGWRYQYGVSAANLGQGWSEDGIAFYVPSNLAKL